MSRRRIAQRQPPTQQRQAPKPAPKQEPDFDDDITF